MRPHDPVRVAETRAWVTYAYEDLRAGQHDLAASPPLLEDAVFHAQQAAEKALKGFLTWHDRPFRKTHDLAVLGGQCVELDSTLDSLLRRAAPLTEYAWKFRYPGGREKPASEEVRAALTLAQEVVDAVGSRLPAEVRA